MLSKIELKHILIIAFLLRLIAVFFSKGFGWSDDQFEVIEVAHSWVRGWDYWLRDGTPSVHSVVYPGFNFLILWISENLGITDGQDKMFIVRLVHALFSLLTVFFGYKITERLAGSLVAKKVGLLLACFWLFPYLSVRNLIEWFCVPFCMFSFWVMLLAEKETRKRLKYVLWIIAGFGIGTAFGIRIMSLIFGGGVGLALMYRKELQTAIVYGLGIILGMFSLQGTVDGLVWGNPLGSTRAFIEYNMTQHGLYPTNHPLFFILVILGIFIPPVSIFLSFGFIRTIKKHLLLFMPAFCFLLFHSLFPNRQERFIFPMLPLFIVLGVIGWESYVSGNVFFNKYKNFYRKIIFSFIFINAILLLVVATHYGKKSRCEPWTIIARQGDLRDVIIHVHNDNFQHESQFYLNNQKPIHQPVVQLTDSDDAIHQLEQQYRPNYIVFIRDEKLTERTIQMKRIYPRMYPLEIVQPGIIDRLVHFMNPKNNPNFVVHIYKTGT